MIFGNRLYFQKKKGGFTMVELIVVLTIVAILAAISFVSYTSMMSDARNSVRKTDMSEMKVRLRGIAQKVGAYPLPSAPFAMTNSGYLAVNQGNTDTVETEEGGSPRKDPKSKTSYVYSTVTNRHGYQIGMILEGENDTYNSLVDGDYIPLVPSVFPSLILAITSTSTIEVHDGIGAGSANRTKFVVQNGTLNLPYNITG